MTRVTRLSRLIPRLLIIGMLTIAGVVASVPASAATISPVRIEVGGSSYKDMNGMAWGADQGFSGGLVSQVTTAGIAGTTDDRLYQTARYGRFGYSVPVPNGTYEVMLKFAETYWTTPGQRVFDVSSEGFTKLDDFDVLRVASRNTAVDKSFSVDVSDGVLDLAFAPSVDNARVNAIQIVQKSVATSDPAPTTPPADDPYSPNAYGAGLSEPFLSPSAVTGRSLNVQNYGATPSASSDDDAAAIRKAIAAAVTGDEVYIPDGVYDLKTNLIELKTGVSVRGQSRVGTVLRTNIGTLQLQSGSTYEGGYLFGTRVSGADNLTISDFTVTKVGGTNVHHYVMLKNSARVGVRNLALEKFEKSGIWLLLSKHVKVEGNYIREALNLGAGGNGYGVRLEGTEQGNTSSNNNWVIGNVVDAPMRHPFLLQYYTNHNLVEQNIARNSNDDAFDLHGQNEYANELRYNKASGVGSLPSTTAGSGAGFGLGNDGYTHHDTGRGNYLHHNESFGNKYGVAVILESHGQYIEDNNLHHNSWGFRAYNNGGDNLTIKRNQIQFNTAGGVYADSSLSLVLTDGNVVTDNAGYGLYTTGTVTGYTITGNDFRNNQAGVFLGSTTGLFENNLR